LFLRPLVAVVLRIPLSVRSRTGGAETDCGPIVMAAFPATTVQAAVRLIEIVFIFSDLY
jgi:hypothetical protein